LNILFVNYGDFTTNSLNHIAGFANALCSAGHACIVAVPDGKDSVAEIPEPRFIAATYDELLGRPGPFPDGREADVVHAWTPRECVRKFVLAYQKRARARMIIHLEDNEEFLAATWFGRADGALKDMPENEIAERSSQALAHPRRFRPLLWTADGITVIVDALRKFAPPGVPCLTLPPGIDFQRSGSGAAEPGLRGQLGIKDGERVIVFTGSNTFANEPEMRELYEAVALLNTRGVPTRLVRTGRNAPEFEASLPKGLKTHVIDLGFVAREKLPAILSLADALVQPGRSGPFNDFRLPSKVPEFLASGRPVILPATNIGLELRDGVDAVLLRTGGPREIAEACLRVFTDAGLARTLGENGAAFARRRFDLAKNTRTLSAFYEEVRGRAIRAGSTAAIGAGETESTLSLRALAAQSADPEAAALASDLAPRVAELETGDPSRAERNRLDREGREWKRQFELTRQHAANLEEQAGLTRQHVKNIEDRAKATQQHVVNLEGLTKASQQRTSELEELFKATQQHATNLEAQVKISGQRAAELEDLLKGSRQQATDLEAEVQISRQRTTELEDLLKASQHHAAYLEEQAKAAHLHAAGLEAAVARLNREVTTGLGRIKTLEGRQFLGDRLLSAARRQFEILDADFAAERQRFDQLSETLRLTRQHSINVDRFYEAAEQRIAELDEQCAHLTRTIDARDRVIARLEPFEARLRTVLDSFSWRATMPWRFLRRKLIDPLRKPKSAASASSAASAVGNPKSAAGDTAGGFVPTFLRHLDSPETGKLPARATKFRGWCFAETSPRLVAVRAVLPDRAVDGKYGLKRADVFVAMPGMPQAEHCGWEVEVDLVIADASIAIEAADESGTWHRLHHLDLSISEDASSSSDFYSYDEWVATYDRHTAETLELQTGRAAAFSRQPLISVIMPVYNTPERWLRRAIDSVRAQSYPRWELCIADDASTAASVREILEQAERKDPRIKVMFRARNGHISAASNSALELATGEFTALLDHDDELAPNALCEVVAAINARPDADYIYTDHDKIDEEGRRHEPYFKPDWLPDLSVAQNYSSHLSIYRTALIRQVGGFRAGMEGSQDWDLTLRVMEQTDIARIVHIPKVLYHWRAIEGSTALLLSEKSYPVEAARRALADHFTRLGKRVDILPVPGGHWRIRYPLPADPPLVSLIIPTRNQLSFLRRCVDSILEKTTYPNFEIVVVDNGSDDPDTLAYLKTLSEGTHPLLKRRGMARVLEDLQPFNYSRINNSAVRNVQGTLVGLLNNDVEVINPDWLDEMASQALRDGIGCVGAMLYYPNNTIQHAGCVLGVGGVAGHAFKTFPRGAEGTFNRARLVQNYSAVTAACLVVRKEIYTEVGGFDENELTVAFNDIDFCLKVLAAGYRNLWTPFAELYHHESASRGLDDTPEKFTRMRGEVQVMLSRWNGILSLDPAYNPNLTLEHENFLLASPPRTENLQTSTAA